MLHGISNGDRSALDEIYQRYGSRVYGFVQRMTRNSSVSEDITHEAFLVLIEHPDRYQSERGSILTFLCAVARNSVMNHLRRKHNRDADFDDLENFDIAENGSDSDPLATLITQELADRIDVCIAGLPPFQREVLVLREYEELSYEEIASITDTEPGTVKARLYRARQNLAKELAAYLGVKKQDKCYELQ